MTTTVFKKDKTKTSMASDSRVTWVNKESGLPLKWFDCPEFKKTITIDDVMYGFAGANLIFGAFLEHYKTREQSETLLDHLVATAEANAIQFFIIRYDGQNLKLFAYSPRNENSPEIYRASKDEPLQNKMYAIGSGKYSLEFQKSRKDARNAKLPIYKIIKANESGMKKHGVLELDRKVQTSTITPEESKQAYDACASEGGDIFTGGMIKMSESANRDLIARQAKLVKEMDMEAKAHGAVCASPVDARLEVVDLEKLGQVAVSKNKVEITDQDLFNKLSADIKAVI